MPVKSAPKPRVRHKKYTDIIRNEDVRAIAVTEKNYHNVAIWSDGLAISRWQKDANGDHRNTGTGERGNLVEKRVRLKTKKGIRVARVGDYVVREADGSFIVVKKADFEPFFKLSN